MENILFVIEKIRNLIVKINNFIFCTEFFFNERVKSYGFYTLKNAKKIKLNGNVIINDGVYINGLGGIEFGDNVILSADCKLISTGLKITSCGFYNDHTKEKITLGSNIQIGAGAIILQGVNICDNVIIGAGALVCKNINEPGVYVGAPAKKIRGFKNV